MSLSVIVRTKDEADRLRLTLTSLGSRISSGADVEVVVVDDGSSDHTDEVMDEAAGWAPLVAVRHAQAKGRGGASNAGARAASGDVLLFLDGDTLVGPDCLSRHLAFHAQAPHRLGRGETLHLRGTRYMLDPETATPRPGERERLARMPLAERDRLKVTRRQILEDFAGIDRRSEPGVYPGAGPRELYALEIAALRDHPGSSVLWAAASGSNFSVPREAFLAVGGFDEALDNNEHRELALRLCTAGCRMALVDGARTYHMTHRSGWRDPLVESDWESVFYDRHPCPEVKLLSVFWASLSGRRGLPEAMRVRSLPELERAARGETAVDWDAVRRLIPGLPVLGAFGVPAAG
jgi:glycosyltransferase involved in cell wall biosynthesis